MNIEVKDFSGEGMSWAYENQKWKLGIKNWKPANDIEGIDCLERHNETDELFVLLSGACTLVYANKNGEDLDIQAVKMEPFKVYKVPVSLWHNTVTQRETKIAVIEDSSTGSHNSDVLPLDKKQISLIKQLSL